MKYDLAIAHRVCPTLSATAIGFDSKLDMVKVTTASLVAALHGLKVHLIVLLDGCPYEYEEIFVNSFAQFARETSGDSCDMQLVRTPAIGNHATWARQIAELLAVDDAPFLYFSEDDYLYDTSAFHAMIDFLKRNPKVDFVSPLDHPDRYRKDMIEVRRGGIKVSPYCHWREISTTCLTFMMRKNDLIKTQRAFATYARGNLDCTMWIGLTKDGVFNVFRLLAAFFSYCRRSPEFGRMLPLAAWKWRGLGLLVERRYHLWSPIPTLAVHLSSVSLPLEADRYFKSITEREIVKKQMGSYLGFDVTQI